MSDTDKLPLPDLENNDVAPADPGPLVPDAGATNRVAEVSAQRGVSRATWWVREKQTGAGFAATK